MKTEFLHILPLFYASSQNPLDSSFVGDLLFTPLRRNRSVLERKIRVNVENDDETFLFANYSATAMPGQIYSGCFCVI